MEIWKKVKGYQNRYEVSSYGRVRSSDMFVDNRHGTKSLKKGRILSQYSNCGYMQVSLSENGKRSTLKAHRVVALAFIDNPENLPYINHKDCNPSNNNVDNLEWCTPSQNVIHAIENNRIAFAQGQDNHNSKLTNNQVGLIREYLKSGSALKPLADYFGVSITVISNIKNNKSWKTV